MQTLKITKMKRKTKVIIASTALYTGLLVGIFGGSLLGVRGCNNSCNNRTVKKESYCMKSYATGISGHVEYIRFADGSQDVKTYPSFGHRLWDSELHQDLDGDGHVDRIRRNGSEFKMNSLSELLVRKADYEKHKKRFDDADEQLQELAAKYCN